MARSIAAAKPNLSTYLVVCTMSAYLGACATQYIGLAWPSIKHFPITGSLLSAILGFMLLRHKKFAGVCLSVLTWPARQLIDLRDLCRSFKSGFRDTSKYFTPYHPAEQVGSILAGALIGLGFGFGAWVTWKIVWIAVVGGIVIGFAARKLYLGSSWR